MWAPGADLKLLLHLKCRVLLYVLDYRLCSVHSYWLAVTCVFCIIYHIQYDSIIIFCLLSLLINCNIFSGFGFRDGFLHESVFGADLVFKFGFWF
jgi:hypothetical protein